MFRINIIETMEINALCDIDLILAEKQSNFGIEMNIRGCT